MASKIKRNWSETHPLYYNEKYFFWVARLSDFHRVADHYKLFHDIKVMSPESTRLELRIPHEGTSSIHVKFLYEGYGFFVRIHVDLDVHGPAIFNEVAELELLAIYSFIKKCGYTCFTYGFHETELEAMKTHLETTRKDNKKECLKVKKETALKTQQQKKSDLKIIPISLEKESSSSGAPSKTSVEKQIKSIQNQKKNIALKNPDEKISNQKDVDLNELLLVELLLQLRYTHMGRKRFQQKIFQLFGYKVTEKNTPNIMSTNQLFILVKLARKNLEFKDFCFICYTFCGWDQSFYSRFSKNLGRMFKNMIFQKRIGKNFPIYTPQDLKFRLYRWNSFLKKFPGLRKLRMSKQKILKALLHEFHSRPIKVKEGKRIMKIMGGFNK